MAATRPSNSADMAAQAAALGYYWNGVQMVPIEAAPEPTYDQPAYDPYAGGGGGLPSLGSINDSPDWQTLMAELDRQGGMMAAEAQRQKAIAAAERDRLLGDLTIRGELEREGVQGAMESRGLYRSGETEQNLARQRQNELSRSTAINSGAATRIGDIEAQLAMQESELARKRAEARADFLARGFTA